MLVTFFTDIIYIFPGNNSKYFFGHLNVCFELKKFERNLIIKKIINFSIVNVVNTKDHFYSKILKIHGQCKFGTEETSVIVK